MAFFRKPVSYYDGFLQVTITMWEVVMRRIGLSSDSVGICGYVAAWMHQSALNGGVRSEHGERLAEHMAQDAAIRLGSSPVIENYCCSFELALLLLNDSLAEDRLGEFYALRSDVIEWTMSEPEFRAVMAEIGDAASHLIHREYPQWVDRPPA